MEGRAKVTKEVLCEEARFILANVMAEARYGRQNRYDDIRRVCEGAVSIPFQEYIGFLEKSGYLRHDRANENLEVTPEGETVVNGGNLAEFTERAVSHFKKLRQSRAMGAIPPTGNSGGSPAPSSGIPMGTQSGVMSSSIPSREVSGAAPLPRKDPKMTTSGGRPSAMAGGEIQVGAEVLETRYEKLASIGSGGMGTVYRARQVALNREVALKEIRDLFGFFSEDQRNEIVRRFTDVVRAWGNLAHPNILPIHDVNLYTEFPNVVTELAPNGSGRRLINDAEEIPVELVFKYLLQTLHALRAAHAQRVYHRGLKPEQLLIDGYGNVKVSDFGFTRLVERDHAVIRQIYVGMGNVAYMAPELYSDPMMSGPQGDIYALGIIFYELLTRKLPGRRSPMPSQLNPNLPRGIDDIFDRMTRDSRSERYATVDDILDDIDKLEGMDNLLDRQNQVLVGDSPLSSIKFRPGAEEPLAGTPVEGEEGDDKKGPSHRPYSFQQRRNKKI
ncbi:MAG: serine/threonine protein kinase [Deltaproteobacteria bacterium]|nr:serine/threonine protein kinase [Deltaproteobacteria bacterium]MCW5803512.1 serine/threonine protein kinase [Deltaproteobacteria bacterium]